MKRQIMFVTALAVIAIGAYWGQKLVNQKSLSDLQLANIEALTQEETKQFEYPTGAPYVTICNVAIGNNWFGTTRCSVTVITCQGGGSGCNSKKCPHHSA